MRRIAVVLIFSFCVVRMLPVFSGCLQGSPVEATSAYAAETTFGVDGGHALHAFSAFAEETSGTNAAAEEHPPSHGKTSCPAQLCCQWYMPAMAAQIFFRVGSPLVFTSGDHSFFSLSFVDLFRPPRFSASC